MTTDELGWLMLGLVIFEGLQVLIMNITLSKIKAKLELVVPEGKTASQILSDTIVQFMSDLRTDDQKAKIMIDFIRVSADQAFDEVSKKIPMLKGAGEDNPMIQKAIKNPWAAVGYGVAQALVPLAKEALDSRRSADQKGDQNSGSRRVNF